MLGLLPLGLLLAVAPLLSDGFVVQRFPLATPPPTATTPLAAASGSSRGRLVAIKTVADWALLFDCDGVLADTERDGHRPAFNEAFQRKGIAGCDWTVPLYGELLKIGGGKERMTAHWNKVGWPSGYGSFFWQRASRMDSVVRHTYTSAIHDDAIHSRTGPHTLR